MGRNIEIDARRGGGAAHEILFGEVTIEATALHQDGTKTVFPDYTPVGISNGLAVLENVDVSPDGPQPAWAYRMTFRNSQTGRGWTELVGVPAGTSAVKYPTLPRFTTALPPETTKAELQNWVATTEAAKNTAVEAAATATAPTDEMVAGKINTQGSATEIALSAMVAGQTAGKLDAYPPAIQGSKSRVYPQKLPKLAAALDAVKAGTRDAKILCLGDSTMAGVGGNTANSSSYLSSWPSFMVEDLDRIGISTVHGLQVPGSVSIPVETRWALGAGWSKGSQGNIGFGNKGMHFEGTIGSGSLTFKDTRILADRFDIYYVCINGNVDYRRLAATATGGATVSQSTTVAGLPKGEIRKFTVSAATASTDNSVAIQSTGTVASATVIGVEPWLSTGPKRVRVGNAGASGSNSTGWATVYNTSQEWATDGSIKAYAPDLTIIDLGINDAHTEHNTSAATYRANLQKLIDWASISGDVILKSMIPSAADVPERLPNEAAYVAEMKALGLPFVDTNGQYGTYVKTNAAGLMSDTLHGNAAMYKREGVDFAALLADLI